MAKIVVKTNGEISSSAGIIIPSGLTISGNVIIGDNFTDTLTVNAAATFNDDLTVIDTISGSIGRYTSITGSIVTGSTAQFTTVTGSIVTGSSARFNNITGTILLANATEFVTGSLSAGERTNLQNNTKIYSLGSITAQSGTAAAPAFNFGAQPGSGMFWAANAQVGFSANGTEVMRYVNDANSPKLGINQNSPTGLLHATLSTSTPNLAKIIVSNPTAGNTNISYDLQGDQSLNIRLLNIPHNATAFGEWTRGGVLHASGSTALSNDSNLHYSAVTHKWYRNAGSGSADRIMTLNSSGNLGIGNSSPNAKLDVNGNAIVSGNLTITGSTALATISGTTAQFTTITSSFTGSGAGLYSLTASGISNFTNDVRAQFSAGTNITIVNGVISSTGGGGGGGSADLGLVKNVAFVTGSTVLTNDNHVVLVNCSTQSITLTLPSASSAGIRSFIVKKIDSTSNNVTISGSTTSEKIDGNNSISFYTQYECFTIISDATSSWYIV